MSDIDESFCKLDYYIFIYYAYFLKTANLRNISSLVRTISIVCTIPCQRLFVPNLILVGVVLERSLEENSCSESFNKTGEVIKDSFLSKVGELCSTAYVNKIKVLIDKHFFHYFKENLGINLTHFSPTWPFM